MSNILIINLKTEPSVLICNDFFIQMSTLYDINIRILNLNKIRAKDILWADCLVSIRTMNFYEYNLIKYTKKLSKYVILFLDDNFFEIQDFNSKRMFLEKKTIINSLRESNFLLVINKYLLYTLSNMNINSQFVITNYYINCDDLFKFKNYNNKILNFVYYQVSGSNDYFNKIFIPILRKFFEKYNEKIKFTFFAINPDLSEFNDKIEKVYYERTDLKTFRKLLSENYFDIGITVIDDTEFSKSKYVNHFFEYTRAGIASIYSNVTPYKEFVINNETGILCDNNDIDSWINAILKLKNIEFRGKIVNKAQDFLIKNYSKEIVVNKLYNDLKIPLEYNSKIKSGFHSIFFIKIYSYSIMFVFFIKKIFYRLKKSGIKSVVNWGVNHYILKKSNSNN